MGDVLGALGCGKAFAFHLASCPLDSTVETLKATTERTFCKVRVWNAARQNGAFPEWNGALPGNAATISI